MFIQTLKNLQGDTFPSAVIAISDAYFTAHQNKSFTTDGGILTDVESSGNELRYRVFYWKGQTSKDAGNSPYVLNSYFDKAAAVLADPTIPDPEDNRTTDDKLWHIVTDLGASYLSLTAVGMAEKHLKEVTLPSN